MHNRRLIMYYVNDIAIKNHDKNDHLCDLKTLFDIMRAYQLKNEPNKVLLRRLKWQVPGIHYHIKRNPS